MNVDSVVDRASPSRCPNRLRQVAHRRFRRWPPDRAGIAVVDVGSSKTASRYPRPQAFSVEQRGDPARHHLPVSDVAATDAHRCIVSRCALPDYLTRVPTPEPPPWKRRYATSLAGNATPCLPHREAQDASSTAGAEPQTAASMIAISADVSLPGGAATGARLDGGRRMIKPRRHRPQPGPVPPMPGHRRRKTAPTAQDPRGA